MSYAIPGRSTEAAAASRLQHVDQLATPAPLVELAVLEANLARVAEYARAHGLALRPHTKTHKSAELAGAQVALGAAGVTSAGTPLGCAFP